MPLFSKLSTNIEILLLKFLEKLRFDIWEVQILKTSSARMGSVFSPHTFLHQTFDELLSSMKLTLTNGALGNIRNLGSLRGSDFVFAPLVSGELSFILTALAVHIAFVLLHCVAIMFMTATVSSCF